MQAGVILSMAFFAYLCGAIPFSFFIAKAVSGKDLTKVGTGNIGAMNVRRATDSWTWFLVAMLMDGVKGFFPVLTAAFVADVYSIDAEMLKGVALIAAVIGHNYSVIAYRVAGTIQSGRGLATGGGGLLAYNPLYLLIALGIGLPAIFISRYLLVGQLLVPVALPVVVYFINPEDFPYILLTCLVVFIRHIPRAKQLLAGREPKWNIKDYRQV